MNHEADPLRKVAVQPSGLSPDFTQERLFFLLNKKKRDFSPYPKAFGFLVGVSVFFEPNLLV